MDFIDVLKEEYRAVVGYDLYSNADQPNEAILDYKIEELFNPWDIKMERTVFSRDITLRVKGTKAPIAKFINKISERKELETDISENLANFLKDVIVYEYVKKYA